MRVTIINSRGGTPIAHRAGCKDIARTLRAEGFHGQDADHFTAEFASKRQAFLDYNSDFIAEADGDETAGWEFHWAPCCDRLPNTECTCSDANPERRPADPDCPEHGLAR